MNSAIKLEVGMKVGLDSKVYIGVSYEIMSFKGDRIGVRRDGRESTFYVKRNEIERIL